MTSPRRGQLVRPVERQNARAGRIRPHRFEGRLVEHDLGPAPAGGLGEIVLDALDQVVDLGLVGDELAQILDRAGIVAELRERPQQSAVDAELVLGEPQEVDRLEDIVARHDERHRDLRVLATGAPEPHQLGNGRHRRLEALEAHDAAVRVRGRGVERDVDRLETEQQRQQLGLELGSVGDQIGLRAIGEHVVQQAFEIAVERRLAVALEAEHAHRVAGRRREAADRLERQLLLDDAGAADGDRAEGAGGVALAGRAERHALRQAQELFPPDAQLERRNEAVEGARALATAVNGSLEPVPARQAGVGLGGRHRLALDGAVAHVAQPHGRDARARGPRRHQPQRKAGLPAGRVRDDEPEPLAHEPLARGHHPYLACECIGCVGRQLDQLEAQQGAHRLGLERGLQHMQCMHLQLGWLACAQHEPRARQLPRGRR